MKILIIAQKLGFSLAEIKEQLARLPDGRAPTKRDWEKISRSFKTRIDERIAGLERLRDNLSGCIGCGCLSLKVCRIYNEGDNIAAKGPGPRFLLGDRPSETT